MNTAKDAEFAAKHGYVEIDTSDHYAPDPTSTTVPVDFYGGPFSNFAESTIILPDPWGEPMVYPTVEHYFAAWKARTKGDHDFVAAATSPGDAKARGRGIVLRSDWEDVKYTVMLVALRAKFADPEYRATLLATGTREIREDSPTDFVWGYRNNGQNLLGKALMEVRAEIRGMQ